MQNNKSFGKNAALNIFKTVCSVIFPLITFPYVSRVLGPEGYGKYSFCNSIVSYFLLAAMLGINTYGIREGARIRDNKNALQDFANDITFINFISVITAYFFLTLCTLLIPKLYDNRIVIAILSLNIVCTFVGRDWINTVFEDYFYITIRYIVIQVISLVAIFLLVKSNQGYTVYSGIVTFSASAGYIVNLFYTRRYIAFKVSKPRSIKKYLIPIFVLFCGQLATMVYIQSDITMLGFLRTESEVGVYAFASKIYLLTKSVINAVTTVAIPRIVYYLGKNDTKSYNKFSSHIVEILFAFGLPSVVGMFLLSKEIMVTLGGTEYISGSGTLMILSFALIFAIYSGFFANAILIPNRKENDFLIITIIAALINIGLNFILIPQIGIIGAAITTLISEAFVTIVSWIRGRKVSSISIRPRNLISAIIGTISIAIICTIVKKMCGGALVSILIAVPISIVLYIVLLLILNNSIVVDVIDSLKLKYIQVDKTRTEDEKQ